MREGEADEEEAAVLLVEMSTACPAVEQYGKA
jgi:hypothetical protein